MLTELTQDQDHLLDVVASEYIDNLTKPAPPPNDAAIRAWLDIAYGLYGSVCPERIEVVGSPYAALTLANSLLDPGEERMRNTDYTGLGDGGWLAFYEALRRLGVKIEKEFEKPMAALREFSKTCYDTVLLDSCAIVIARPAMEFDEQGNLHCEDGPALAWMSGEKDYVWHGIWVPERLIMSPRTYSKAEYLAITNTEERRALSEHAGWSWVAELLGAKTVDSWTDPETHLGYILMEVDGGQRLLQKQSPRLKDGSQPTYVEPVHEELKTAQAARKWQATRLTPVECEADPALVFGVEA
jgi:hypothetical protein